MNLAPAGDRAGEVMAEQVTGRGARGVVLAAAPMAASIGAEVLRGGGTAFDAVVAAGIAETVLLPPKCGLAGDLVGLIVTPDHPAPRALLAIGRAPAGLAGALARRDLPATGGLAVGVPGAPAGWQALAGMGTRGLAELSAPAADLARNGFPWAPICHTLAVESAALVALETPGGCRYYPGGRPLAAGELVRLPGLAVVVDALAERGAALFDGPVGDAVVAAVAARGGVLRRDDLVPDPTELVSCIDGRVGDWRVWATPTPTHGVALLDGMAGFEPGGAADDVWQRFHGALARLGGGPVRAGTSMVSAADDAGNAVVVMHSNSFPRFGSGIVVDGFDLILNNRAGRGFAEDPASPFFPRPGARPETTLHLWGAGRAGPSAPGNGGDSGEPDRPYLLAGTPGGVNQLPWNCQLLADLVAGETDPGRLVTAPRWGWSPDGDGATVEEDADGGTRAALARCARSVTEVARWSQRSAQQVLRVPRPGEVVSGAVDPRIRGAALGA